MTRVFLTLLSVLLVCALTLPAFADAGDNDTPFIEPTGTVEASTETTPVPESPAPTEGLTFDIFGTYPLEKAFGTNVRAIEVQLRLSPEDKNAMGVILSNEDKDAGTAYLTFSVYKRGVPRVTYVSADGITYDYRFEEVDVRSEDWVHLAIVLDPDAGAMHCYVDGALAETLTMDRSEKPYVDYREG